MKRNAFTAAAACILLFGTVWAVWPAPASEQVWSHQKLQPVDYRQLHSNALTFVTVKGRQGFELRARCWCWPGVIRDLVQRRAGAARGKHGRARGDSNAG